MSLKEGTGDLGRPRSPLEPPLEQTIQRVSSRRLMDQYEPLPLDPIADLTANINENPTRTREMGSQGVEHLRQEAGRLEEKGSRVVVMTRRPLVLLTLIGFNHMLVRVLGKRGVSYQIRRKRSTERQDAASIVEERDI